MRKQQTDVLVDFAPNRGVLPFPLARRRAKVIDVARTIASRRTADGKRAYWSRVVAILEAEMREHGIEDLQIERELRAFFAVVDLEIARLQHVNRRQPG